MIQELFIDSAKSSIIWSSTNSFLGTTGILGFSTISLSPAKDFPVTLPLCCNIFIVESRSSTFSLFFLEINLSFDVTSFGFPLFPCLKFCPATLNIPLFLDLELCFGPLPIILTKLASEMKIYLLKQCKYEWRQKKYIDNHRSLGAPYASGILSMLYLWLLRNMMGTPGIFRILLLRSLSQVATMYALCWVTRLTRQSSA